MSKASKRESAKVAAPLLTVCSLVNGLCLFVPLIASNAVIYDHFGSEVAYIVNGVLSAGRAAFAFAFQPAIGALTDARGRKPVLVVLLLVSTLPTVALLFGSATTYAILSVVCGAAGATTSVVLTGISDSTDEEHRAGALGIVLALTYGLAKMIGIPLGALLEAHVSFAAAIAMQTANALFVWLAVPETHERDGKAAALGGDASAASWSAISPCRVFALLQPSSASPALWALCAIYFLTFCGFFGWLFNVQFYLMGAFEMTPTQTTPLMTCAGASGMLGMASVAALRGCGVNEHTILTMGLCLQALGYGLWCNATGTRGLLVAAGVVGFGSMAQAVQPAIATLMAHQHQLGPHATTARIGEVMGLVGSFMTLAEGLGPLLMGVALSATAEWSSRLAATPYLASSLCSLSGVACYWSIVAPARRREGGCSIMRRPLLL